MEQQIDVSLPLKSINKKITILFYRGPAAAESRGPEGAMRRRRVEIRQLHSSKAGEALTRLLQVQMDFCFPFWHRLTFASV